MADEKKRQQRLMKKKKKEKQRKQKQSAHSQTSSPDPRRLIRRARQFPVYECIINSNWRDRGLAHIILSRKQPDNNVLFGCYLVDLYCLGLKNTFCNAGFSEIKYQREFKARYFEAEDGIECSIPLAHSIIYGAIEYAAQFGFKPNRDYGLSKYVLEDEQDLTDLPEVEFGKDGKPLYIAGPDDNAEKIISQLEKTAGKDNFHFIYELDL